MCFTPQRRALFRHLNFQKWSDVGVFCTFLLGNVLRATTACTFSTSLLLELLRSWGALYLLTWTCVSRHNDVQLFISHLARWLRTRRFTEVTCRPSGATNHWKNTGNRDCPTFSRTCIFFTFSPLWSSHFFSSPLWLFPPLLCHLPILSEVWLLSFLRQDYVNYEGIYSTAHILGKASNKGIAKIGLSIGKYTRLYYNSIFVRFKLSFRTSRFRVAWKIWF